MRIDQLPPEQREWVRAYAERLRGLSPTALGYALIEIGNVLQEDRRLIYPQASAVARAIWEFLGHPSLATEYGDDTFDDFARARAAAGEATTVIEAGRATLH